MQNIKLHFIQTELIKKLTLNPKLKFKDLVLDGFESEHISYHLNQLKELKLVSKLGEYYELSNKGKDYSNQLDDEIEIIEKQPKTAVLCFCVRKNPETNQIENLLNKRLKQPYYGKVGRIGGKVRFGETLKDAALRELKEETGLSAKKVELQEIYHKIRHTKDGEVVQDVIFYIFFMTDFEGTLIEKLPYQENFWISKNELQKRKDLDTFDDLEISESLEPKQFKISESIKLVKGF